MAKKFKKIRLLDFLERNYQYSLLYITVHKISKLFNSETYFVPGSNDDS